MTRDPEVTLLGVFTFLNIEPGVAEQLLAERRNTFQLPRGPLAGSILHSGALRAAGRRSVPARFRPRLEDMLLKSQEKPPLDPEVRRLLEDVYAVDAEALSRLLGRPLPWSNSRA